MAIQVCYWPNCSRPAWQVGLCTTHESRQRFGRDMNAPMVARTLSERLERYDVTETGCWVMRGHRVRGGYVLVRSDALGHPKVYAHRAAWEQAHGPIPDGRLVLHECDNPPCVNPNPGHLHLGTQVDNVAEMEERGRAWWQNGWVNSVGGRHASPAPSPPRRG